MEKFLKEVGQIFDAYEAGTKSHLERHVELILQKANLVGNLLKLFEYAWETACERNKEIDFTSLNRYRPYIINESDRDKLYSEILSRETKAPSARKEFPNFNDHKSSEEERAVLSDYDYKQLEILKLFLKKDYEPPTINPDGSQKTAYALYRALSDHLSCLSTSYVAILATEKYSAVALHQLDIAAMKLIPKTTNAMDALKDLQHVKIYDSHIKTGAGRSRAAKANPERQAFDKALRQLVDEFGIGIFTEFKEKSKFIKIKAQMARNGFRAFKVMDLCKKKSHRRIWLKEELECLKK